MSQASLQFYNIFALRPNYLSCVIGEQIINAKSKQRSGGQQLIFQTIYRRENIKMALDFMLKKGMLNKFQQIGPEGKMHLQFV